MRELSTATPPERRAAPCAVTAGSAPPTETSGNTAPSRNHAGWTLIELTVVIGILVALAAVVVPMVSSSLEDARIARILDTVDVLRKASHRFHSDLGSYAIEHSRRSRPDQHQFALEQNDVRWKGPYIDHPLGRGDNPYDGHVIVLNKLSTANFGGFRVIGAGGPRLRGRGNFVRFTNIPQEVARRIDDLLEPGVQGNWKRTGRLTWRGGRLDVLLAQEAQ